MNLNQLRVLLAECLCGTEFAGNVWFAGGCVRDGLLHPGTEVLDADLAVELPAGGVRLARFLESRLPTTPPEIPRGFGTASSVHGSLRLDFAMTRREFYQPGSRHPRVSFAPLPEDCRRRDFTVNALYLELCSGQLLDPCSRGLDDLRDRLLRCVAPPHHSFAEDPLRILRGLRFAAVLGFVLEAETRQAMRDLAPLVGSLSKRRQTDELGRLASTLDAPGWQRWQELNLDTGVVRYLSVPIPQPLT